MAAIGTGRRRCRDENRNRADFSRCRLVQPMLMLTCHAQLVTKAPSTPHVQHSMQAVGRQESAALDHSCGSSLAWLGTCSKSTQAG